MTKGSEVEEQTIMKVVLDMSERLGVMEQKMDAIPHDRHNEEHEYLKLEIEAKKARRDFYRDVSAKLATTTIIGAFGLLITALGYGFTQWLISLKP